MFYIYVIGLILFGALLFIIKDSIKFILGAIALIALWLIADANFMLIAFLLLIVLLYTLLKKLNFIIMFLLAGEADDDM